MGNQELYGKKIGSRLHFFRADKEIMFDLRDNTFYRKLKTGELTEVKDGRPFFRNLHASDVANAFEDKAYADYIRSLMKANYTKTNIGSILEEIGRYAYLEGYFALGIKGVSHYTNKRPVSDYPKEIVKFLLEGDIAINGSMFERNLFDSEERTKLFTNVVRYIMDKYKGDIPVYRQIFELLNGYSVGQFEQLTKPITEALPPKYHYYRTSTGVEAHTHFGYGLDYKSLIDYLIKIDNTEASDWNHTLTTLKDYLTMSRDIEWFKYFRRIKAVNPSAERGMYPCLGYNRVERYPSYLKVRHDIVNRNYQAIKTSYDEERFTEVVDTKFAYKGKGFGVYVPKSTQDIKDEGTSLNHCVASYIGKVLDGHTQILFLRTSEDESLVTIEVRNDAIVQTRGANNRDLTPTEKNWLAEYARIRNISYGSYERNPKKPTPYVAESKANAEASTQIS